MPVCTGVRDGSSSVLPALPFILSLPLGLGGGKETCQLRAFKLTVCKFFKTTQIYWRKEQFLPGVWGDSSRVLLCKGRQAGRQA